MAASNRDTNLRDHLMYAHKEFPWGALAEPEWSSILLQNHFMYDQAGTSVRYIDELMSPTRIGYNVSRSRMVMMTVRLFDAWSLYAFDMKENKLNVLDPLYQGDYPSSLDHKHADACKCFSTYFGPFCMEIYTWSCTCMLGKISSFLCFRCWISCVPFSISCNT